MPSSRSAVVACALIYAAVLTCFSLARHRALLTQMNDLGNADQAIWSASRGHLSMPQSNDEDQPTISRLAVHVNFIFCAIVPLYWLWSDPRVLLILGSLACAIAGVGLYEYARLKWGESAWSIAPALAWWISPIVHDANLYDFKIITIVAAALIWAVWAFESGRERLGWILCIGILLSQEDFALLPLFLGIYYLIDGERRRGLLLIAVSAIYLAFVFAWFVPWISDGIGLAKLSGSDDRLRFLNGPADVVRVLLRPDRLRLPLYLLLSGAIVALPAWRFLPLLVPAVIACMIVDSAWMTRITGTYYQAVSISIVIIAIIKAGGRWRYTYLLVATAIFTLLFSPLRFHRSDADVNLALSEVSDLIPHDAALSVQNNVGAHFAHRLQVASFPRRIDRAEYVLYHLRYPGGDFATLFQLEPQQTVAVVQRQLQSPDWTLIFQREGFYLFVRRGSASPPDSAAQRQFEEDAARLQREVRRAALRRPRLGWILTGNYGWADLADRLMVEREREGGGNEDEHRSN